MKNVAFFPFTGNALPVVRHFGRLQNTYHVSQVIAWKCLGLSGKDAACIYNHPMVGVPVVNVAEATNVSWDVLFVDCWEMKNQNSSMDYLDFFQKFLIAGKEIIFLATSYQQAEYFSEFYRCYPNQVKIITADSSISYSYGTTGLCSSLPVPILMVGGLIDKSDTLEIILALQERFLAEGKIVSSIVGSNLGLLVGAYSYQHIFETTTSSEEEKILRLNQLARDIIRVERPELLLVEAPDAIAKYNSIIPNGFGIRTYMTTQALNPDFFVCSIPCDLVFSAFLDSASEGISQKYGFPVLAVHASNALVDSAVLIHEHKPTSVHVDMEVVTKFMNDTPKGRIPVYDVISEGAGSLYYQICDTLGLERRHP